MKNLFFHIARAFKPVPLEFLISITTRKLIIPMYHVVSDTPPLHIKHLYKVPTLHRFENDLNYLLRHYKPLTVEDIINYSGKIVKPGFMLTFDDGLREFYENAAPVLIKKGVQAIVFVNPAFINNMDMFYRYKASLLKEAFVNRIISADLRRKITDMTGLHKVKYDKGGDFLLNINYGNRDLLDKIAWLMDIDFNEYLRIQKPYMTDKQIKDLSEKGFLIGAHSLDHPGYKDISDEEQMIQTLKSIEKVCLNFNQKYRLFAFPFTDDGIKAAFFNELYSDVFYGADLSFGTAGIKNDQFNRNLQRIPAEQGNFSFEQVLKGEYLYYLFKMLFGRNIIRRA